MILTGLDVFLESPEVTGPVALLTNVSSLTSQGSTAFRALSLAGVEVTALFGPEHGYFGIGAAGESIDDDRVGNVPIYSLYGKTHAPEVELLKSVRALLFDLQDAGCRWYTYLATLRNCMVACREAETPLYVLDRPNPQGGVIVEGMLAEPKYFSLIAPGPMPARYGLTIGEVARWMNTEIGVDLHVVPMDGWERDMLFTDTELAWSAPSPGIPHPTTTLIYSGTCLVEALSISEGRGTSLPFEQIGAPFIQAEILADSLNELKLPGVIFLPVWFRPLAGKHTGERCKGVRIHITDPREIRGFEMGLHLVSSIRRMYPTDALWLETGDHKVFDRIVATSNIRERLEAGQPVKEIIMDCESDSQTFQTESAAFWLYD